MKMNCKYIIAAALSAALFAAAGCNNPAGPAEGAPAGKAVIRIGGEGPAQARTVSPADTALQGFTYELSFAGPEGASPQPETVSYGGSKTVSLAPGEWVITAQGKEGGAVKAEGSWAGAVGSGEPAEAFIALAPKPGSGEGKFAYTAEFPGLGEGGGKSLTLYAVKPDGTETAVPGTPVTGFTSGEASSISLPAGFYRAALSLSRGSEAAGRTCAVHIYAGLETTAAFKITEGDFGVTKVLSSIAVTSPPLKAAYVIGEGLDTAGMAVTASYADGSNAAVSGWAVSGFDSGSAGTRTLTVSYTEGGVTKTAAFTVTVTAAGSPAVPGRVLSSIAVTTPPVKTAYVIGEGLDTAGMAVTASYSDGSAAAVSGWAVSGFDSAAAGTSTVTVSYSEGGVTKTAAFTVTVAAGPVVPGRVLSSIEITAFPAKTLYTVGEGLDTAGMAVTAYYSDGRAAAVSGWAVSGFDSGSERSRTLRVEYAEGGVTRIARFNVLIARPAPALAGMAYIPGGTFLMGSAQATVSSFYMGLYEVTQAEYLEVMGTNPSSFSGGNLPVEMVDWYDAVAYCNSRSLREGLAPAYRVNGAEVEWDRGANGYRLPTEAEWEYACRAGTDTPFNTGNTITPDQANYSASGIRAPVAAGSFAPNGWGLYDMHGNLWEWCWNQYGGSFQTDPTGGPGPQSYSSYRVIRGGSWQDSRDYISSASRRMRHAKNVHDHEALSAVTPRHTVESGGNFIGFRVARSGS
jgi:formylglycine-generating enzyme required for sulfatase activity